MDSAPRGNLSPGSFIDLVSDDSEGDSLFGDFIEWAPVPQQERFTGTQGVGIINNTHGIHGIRSLNPNANNANSPIDLTRSDTPGSDLASAAPEIADHATGPAGVTLGEDLNPGELLTEAACLQMCLDVLPDISINHVLELIRANTDDSTRTPAACERLIFQLVDSGEYPKEQRGARNNRKRKHSEDEELSRFEGGLQSEETPSYYADTRALLCDVFLEVPQKHIETVLRARGTLFKAYSVIEDELRHYNEHNRQRSFMKCPRSRNFRGVETLLISRGSRIPKELHAAKQKSEEESAKRRKDEEEHEAERANLQRALAAGETIECQCCFDDIPINRVTTCTGRDTHHFCKSCAKTYVETELGSGRCRPVCFANPDCGGVFLRRELQDFLGEKSFGRLEHMQQQEDLAAAGLDFLSECPFCDYKAECLPIETDKEFRCMNPNCEKISCRICNKETHVPLSCEEAKKDESVTIRHIVEEAMSAALIRYCNKCKHAFVKELGCNKMTCSHCRNLQCYVCSENVKSYEHFSDGRGDRRGGKCPLHEDVEARHEAEVKKAADEALAKVQSEHPDISPAELMIQVSDNVKKAEEARREQARARQPPGAPNPPRHGPLGRVNFDARRALRGLIVQGDQLLAERNVLVARHHDRDRRGQVAPIAVRDNPARRLGALAPPAPQQHEPQLAEGPQPLQFPEHPVGDRLDGIFAQRLYEFPQPAPQPLAPAAMIAPIQAPMPALPQYQYPIPHQGIPQVWNMPPALAQGPVPPEFMQGNMRDVLHGAPYRHAVPLHARGQYQQPPPPPAPGPGA